MGGIVLQRTLFGVIVSAACVGGVWTVWSQERLPVSDDALQPVPAASKLPVPTPATPSDSLSPAEVKRLDEVDVPRPRRPVAVGSSPQLRATIERLLPDATPAEREIWSEQLEGLPLGVVEDLLRFREELGPDRAADSSLLMGPGMMLRPPGAFLAPIETGRPGAVEPGVVGSMPRDWQPTVAALRQCEVLTVQNLVQARTPGYQALLPQMAAQGTSLPEADFDGLAEATDSMSTNVVNLRFTGALLDPRPGKLTHTHRPLDVALLPNDVCTLYLTVSTPDGIGLTRCGSLEVDDQHRLAVRLAQALYPLSPEILVPENAILISVDETGEVVGISVEEEQEKELKLGRIVAATVRDPGRLRYHASGWLVVSAASGPVFPLPVSAGPFLQPQHLEQSNVNADEEHARLKWLDDIRQVLTRLTAAPSH